MKKRVLYALAITIALLLSNTLCQAQTKKLIHYWHFNNTASGVHLGAIPADYTTLGNASIIYKPIPGGGIDTSQAYIDNLSPDASDSLNQRPGYAGCCGGTNYAVRTRNPSDYMQFLWYIPTHKYQNIVIKYATESSSTGSGQHRQVFSYSLDSAANFITTGLPVAYDSAGLAFGLVTLNLSSLQDVNNNGKLVFRMLFTPPNTGTSGNNRFDNITVEGDTMIAPVFTSNPLTSGIINRAYSYTITATGSPAPTFSVSGNPGWLSLNDSILSGTPPSIDTVGPITITATNAIGSVQQQFTLIVSDSINPVAPVITSIAPTIGHVDSLYAYAIVSTGVPRPTLSVTGNPGWLVLSDTILSGTPVTDGIFGPIKITATNIVGHDDQSFSIKVPAAPLITSTAITAAVLNTLYSYTIIATGTPTPDLSISGKPSWLTLNGNVLSGTPSAVGSFGPITITAKNTEDSIQQIFTIVVSSAPEITSTAITTGTAGTNYTYAITTSGSPSPNVSIEGNPSWLSLSDGTLSGIPTSSGLIGPITISATNLVSTAKQSFYINVISPFVNTGSSDLIHYWNFNNSLPSDGSGGIHYGPILSYPIIQALEMLS